MKKNVIIFCVFAALAMLFASCKGGGGGDSKDSTTTTTDNAAGVWSDGTDVGGYYYAGMYFTDGKIYLAYTKDKTTFYYNSENAADGTYTTNGNEVTINITGGPSGTAIINGDTMTDKSDPNNIQKRYASAKIEGKTGDELTFLMLSWMTNP